MTCESVLKEESEESVLKEESDDGYNSFYVARMNVSSLILLSAMIPKDNGERAVRMMSSWNLM